MKTKLTIYRSLGAFILHYRIIWGLQLAHNLIGDNNFELTHIPTNLVCLEVAHKKLIRALHVARLRKQVGDSYTYTHTSPLFKNKNALKLQDIYYFHLALFAYDCYYDLVPSSFEKYLLSANNFHRHNTRSTQHQTHLDLLYFKISLSLLISVNQSKLLLHACGTLYLLKLELPIIVKISLKNELRNG